MARYRSFIAVAGSLAVALGGLTGTASAVGTCSTDTTFCITYSLVVHNAGTATTATTAAAPIDTSFSLANTSPTHTSDPNVWLDHVDAHLLSGLGGNVVTPSAQLDNNLLIAGSDTSCSSGSDFSGCTGGNGTAYVEVNGAIYPGSFGVQSVRNINPPAQGFAVDWSITIGVCFNPGIPLCQNSSLEVQANPTTSGQVTIPTSAPINSGGFSGRAAIDTATINLRGIATKVSTGSGDAVAPSGAQTVFHMPTRCGNASASATAVDQAGATALVSATLGVSGCPTARFARTEHLLTAHFDGTTSTTPISGRTVKRWHWTFGDGTSRVTTGPKVSHTYASSRNRTVRLVVEDSLGALSTARSFLLRGSAMTWTASASRVAPGTAVTLSGRLTKWHSTTGLGGRKVLIQRCRVGTNHCTLVKTVTTSRHAGRVGKFSVVVHPTAAGDYRATYFGGGGYLGIRKSHRITMR